MLELSLHINNNKGALHLIPLVINQIESIMLYGGYTKFECDEIDTEWYNFTVLNIPETHPTRTDHQSFYLDNGKMLRTQTSNSQARIFTKYSNKFKTFTIGRTYRNDDDATHTPMFHQMEILACTNKSSIIELINIIKWFMSQFLYNGKKVVEIRLRPSHFPFTDPSYEVDIWYNNQWLEVLGCGITHAKVFENLSLPFRFVMAVGCGIERLAMIKYGLKDIREFYNQQPYNTHKHYELYRNDCSNNNTHICNEKCMETQ